MNTGPVSVLLMPDSVFYSLIFMVVRNLNLHHWQMILFYSLVSMLVNIFLCKNVLQCSGQLFGRGPAGAELHATACVVINHAVTVRLSGLLTTLAAWGPGTSGAVWGR